MRKSRISIILFLLVLAVGLASRSGIFDKQPSIVGKPIGAVTKTKNCHLKDSGQMPDKGCSPGVVLTTNAKKVCVSGYAGKTRNVSQGLKDTVYHAYGIYQRSPGEYEIDHIISLQLGGSNDQGNLFPEKYNMPEGAHDKDKVENRLHYLVCKGKMTLPAAQKLIATDWRKAQGL